jgi:hypothetical protein
VSDAPTNLKEENHGALREVYGDLRVRRRSRSLRFDSIKLMSGAVWRDVVMVGVTSAQRATPRGELS